MQNVIRGALIATMVSIVAVNAMAGELVLESTALVSKGGPRVSGITLVEDGVRNKLPGLKLQAHVAKLVANEVTNKDGTFTTLTIPGMQLGGNVGDPALPVITRLLEVPMGAKVTVKVSGRQVQKVSLQESLGVKAPLMPRQPPQPKDETVVPFAHNPQAYTAPGFQQEPLATVEEVGMLRDHRLVMVKVAPVAYEPTTGKLEVYNDVQIDVGLDGADLALTQKTKATYGSRYFDWTNRATLVPESLRVEPANRPTSFLIVADRAFEAELKSFIEWKTAKGFHVTVSYTDQIGNTADKVKAHIAGLYSNASAEAPAPDFVLFVGDNEQIPAFRGTAGSHITDLPFVCVTGGDDLPDIATGRFSAQTVEQLRPQIEKTLFYEKAQFDATYLKSAVMVAGWDARFAIEWGWPQIKYGIEYYFNAAHGIDTVFQSLSSASNQNTATIVEKMSGGVAYYNYTAHGSQTSFGDPGFKISDINALKNEGKYGLVVGNCCLTNSFQVATCFGEAWLRADKKGAIGYIGATNSTYWDEDLWWGTGNYAIAHPNPQGNGPTQDQTGVGAYEGAFDGNYDTQGSMVICGNLAVQESTSPRKKYYWECYSLMGDPSLKIFFGAPAESTVTHDGTATAGATSLTVAAPVGSYVGVSSNGQLLGAAHVTEARATVPTKPLPAGATLTVVVTGKNLKPYTGTVTVGSGTPDQPTPPAQPAPPAQPTPPAEGK